MKRSEHYIATPPGATIREQLVERGMSQKEFALRMDLSEKHVSKLINGEVQLTVDVALRLEMVLGVPAKFWNNLEAIYREKLARVEAENAMEEDEVLARKLPYSEMARNGWIPQTKEIHEQIFNLRKFFGVVQLGAIGSEQISKIACRRLVVTEKSDLALLAWAQEAKIKARERALPPAKGKGMQFGLEEIRAMTCMGPDEFCPKLKAMLAENGIALVFLPNISGSFLQGVSLMDGNRIVLGMTARGRDADRFWSGLFHELGHITLGHIGKIGGTTASEEEMADNWARDHLIPLESFETFKKEKCYTIEDVKKYALKVGIAPGIVVGRLQNEGAIKHNMLNELKIQYTFDVS